VFIRQERQGDSIYKTRETGFIRQERQGDSVYKTRETGRQCL